MSDMKYRNNSHGWTGKSETVINRSNNDKNNPDVFHTFSRNQTIYHRVRVMVFNATFNNIKQYSIIYSRSKGNTDKVNIGCYIDWLICLSSCAITSSEGESRMREGTELLSSLHVDWLICLNLCKIRRVTNEPGGRTRQSKALYYSKY
jgi:hypothetical protein